MHNLRCLQRCQVSATRYVEAGLIIRNSGPNANIQTFIILGNHGRFRIIQQESYKCSHCRPNYFKSGRLVILMPNDQNKHVTRHVYKTIVQKCEECRPVSKQVFYFENRFARDFGDKPYLCNRIDNISVDFQLHPTAF